MMRDTGMDPASDQGSIDAYTHTEKVESRVLWRQDLVPEWLQVPRTSLKKIPRGKPHLKNQKNEGHTSLLLITHLRCLFNLQDIHVEPFTPALTIKKLSARSAPDSIKVTARLLPPCFPSRRFSAFFLLSCHKDRGSQTLLLELSETLLSHCWFCLVAKSCLTLCNPKDCILPGFPVLHHLPEFAQTHVHWVGDAIESSYPLPHPSPFAFNLSQHHDFFQWLGSSHQVAKILLKLQHQSFQWIFRVDFL